MLSPGQDVLTQLMHKPPFRLLDRVEKADLLAGQLVAIRRLSFGDALWPAESGIPCAATRGFPEVLVIEALCQAAACLQTLEFAASSKEAAGTHLGYLVAISDFRFPAALANPAAQAEGPARLGETLRLSVARQGSLGALSAFWAQAEAIAANASAQAGAESCWEGQGLNGPSGADAPAAGGRIIATGRLLFAVKAK